MNEILDEIFTDAKNSGKMNLLQVLISYEKVIQARKVLYYSEEGVELYKTLLRWGREKTNFLAEKKKDSDYKISSLQITDLCPEPGTQGHRSTNEKSSESPNSAVSKSFDSHQLPSENPAKALNPNEILAEAFANKSLKIRVLCMWIEGHNISLQEKLIELKLIEKKRRYSKAIKFYSNLMLKKVLQGWTRFNLSQLKKKIANQFSSQNKLKVFWKAWTGFHRKNEILNGLKFTASFIHSQWLMKKVMIALTKHVHDEMVAKLKIHRIKERLCSNLVVRSLNSWKMFVNLRLKSKILALRSMKVRVEILKKRGFFQLFHGCYWMKKIRENQQKAENFRISWTYQTVLESWLKFVVKKNRKIFKGQQAVLIRKRRLLSQSFNIFAEVVRILQEQREKCLKIAGKKQKLRVFREWKRVSLSYRSAVYPDKTYFLCYLWLNHGRNFDFGNFFKQVSAKKQTIATECLKMFFKKSLLNTWKESLESFKQFKLKLRMKKVIKIFSCWNEKTKKIVKVKSILNPHIKHKNSETKKKIFKAWAEKYLKIILNKSLFKQFSIQNNRRILSSNLKLWRSRLKVKIRHNRENQISKKLLRKTLLSKYLISWNLLFRKTRKKSELSRLSQIFFLEKYTLKPWNTWRQCFLENCQKDFRSFIKTKDSKSTNTNQQDFQSEEATGQISVKSKSQQIVQKEVTFLEPSNKRHVDSSIQTDSAGLVLVHDEPSQSRNVEPRSIFIRPKFSKLPEANIKPDKTFEKIQKPLHLKENKNDNPEELKQNHEHEPPKIVLESFSVDLLNNKDFSKEQPKYLNFSERNDFEEKKEFTIEKSDIISVKSSNLNKSLKSEIHEYQGKKESILKNDLCNYLEPTQIKSSSDLDQGHNNLLKSSNLDEKSPDSSKFNYLNEKNSASYVESFRRSSESSDSNFLNENSPKSSTLNSLNENNKKNVNFNDPARTLKLEGSNKSNSGVLEIINSSKKSEDIDINHKKSSDLNETKPIEYRHSEKNSSELKPLEEKSFDSTSPINNAENEENLNRAVFHHHFTILKRFFAYIKSNSAFSRQLKSRIVSASLIITKFRNLHLELSVILTLQQINVREIRQINRAKNHKRRKTLKKFFDIMKKRATRFIDLLNKQAMIEKKHKKLQKQIIFNKWIKAIKIRNYSKDMMIKYHFLLVKDIFSKWQTELKIKEIQDKKLYQLKVFSLAGLQIYAEKTFHAKAHLFKAQNLELVKLKKKTFVCWKAFKVHKKKSKFFSEKYLQKLKKISINGFKDYHIQSLIEKEIQGRCQKNLVLRYVYRWRLQLKRKLKLKKLLKKILIHRFVKIESFCLMMWQQVEMNSKANQTVIVKPLRVKKINKDENLLKSIKFRKYYTVSKVFYAWDQFVSDHSIKRRRNFIHSIFMGWKLQTRENALLRKYLIESNLSEKYLQSSVEFTGGLFKSISSLGSFQSINFN